jgi:pilus assembly protein CpaB
MNRTLLIAAGALVAGGFAMFWVYQDAYVAQATGGPRVPVLVATRDIPFGEPMEASWLATRELPRNYVEERHLGAADLRRLIGVPLATGVREGEAILRTDLSALSDLERTLSGDVPPGQRALSIRARPESSHAGMLRPGDRVDVLLVVADARRPFEGTSVVVAQNLLVLAVGHRTISEWDDDRNRPTRNYNTQVNVEVDLEQAQRLTVARRQGQLRVVLRNPNDATVVEDPVDVDASELLAHERRAQWLRRFALVEALEADP